MAAESEETLTGRESIREEVSGIHEGAREEGDSEDGCVCLLIVYKHFNHSNFLTSSFPSIIMADRVCPFLSQHHSLSDLFKSPNPPAVDPVAFLPQNHAVQAHSLKVSMPKTNQNARPSLI